MKNLSTLKKIGIYSLLLVWISACAKTYPEEQAAVTVQAQTTHKEEATHHCDGIKLQGLYYDNISQEKVEEIEKAGGRIQSLVINRVARDIYLLNLPENRFNDNEIGYIWLEESKNHCLATIEDLNGDLSQSVITTSEKKGDLVFKSLTQKNQDGSRSVERIMYRFTYDEGDGRIEVNSVVSLPAEELSDLG